MDQENTFSDILNSLLQNPDIMKTVSGIAGKMNGDTKEPPQAESPRPQSSLSPDLLSKLLKMTSNLGGDSHRRALLSALKPYLSEKRCAVIDGLLQVEGIAGMLETFIDQQ